MAPQEVSGLQALAKAHGGTLTVNPDTGLPEANFLKRMLPTLIGAALTPLTGGLINPMTAGLLVGGLETARTGNLGKGLMAGFGAYGGAGLTSGLIGAGSAELGKTAVTSATGEAAKQGLTGEAYNQAVQNSVANKMAGLSSFDKLSAGLSNPATAMSSMGNGMGVARLGLAALSPSMQEGPQTLFAGSGPNPYEYDYDPNTQRYTRVPPGSRQRDILAPTTGMPGMAMGGPVEEMSDRNQMETMMANGGQMFATGGQINLQGTFDVGGGGGGGGQFGQSNANGYRAAGGGGGSDGMLVGMGGTAENGYKSPGGMGGLDINAIQANPQGFQQWFNGAQQQEKQMPGSTMLGRQSQPGNYDNHMMAPAVMNYQDVIGGRNNMMVQDMQYRPERNSRPFHDIQGAPSFGNNFAAGGAIPARGISNLGDYSDGGRLLKGPGDGVSDSIPATIANKRPARLADGEFVVPARIVSELGNGSTEAGARKLYAMMDRIQKARGKTTGKNRVAVNSRSEKLLPA
jgi:hypothetical protein